MNSTNGAKPPVLRIGPMAREPRKTMSRAEIWDLRKLMEAQMALLRKEGGADRDSTDGQMFYELTQKSIERISFMVMAIDVVLDEPGSRGQLSRYLDAPLPKRRLRRK